ncbi:MAG TPA: hypothetical protein VND64_31145 [Pirellulales bacterium]|nr:hypothetical protein [Pirellulales bacterium]
MTKSKSRTETKSRSEKPGASVGTAPVKSAKVRRRGPRALVLATLAAGLLGAAGYAIWQSVREHVYRSSHYHLSLDDIIVTPRPEWIRTDIKSEVVRDASVDGPLSVLDQRLLQRLREAFALHPWVAKVERVAKRSPARVEVDLVYRCPVCMVQVPGGLFPVDAEGVLLLTADFSPQEASRYPRLSGIPLSTAPPPGVRWPDERVLGGAEIAAALGDVWYEMELHHIQPTLDSTDDGRGGPDYEVVTRHGTRIVWGAAPGADDSGRTAAADKVARLKHFFADHGTLEGVRGSQDLDLRDGTEVRVTPHTAMQPDEDAEF